MGNSILIFAPHPDDEVLGCGGTIIRRIREGYEVYIVFITDGAHSHTQISTKRMKQIRRKEAVIANSVLGVPKKNLFFLGFEDECLNENRKAARNRVKDVLEKIQPVEIYYTGAKDLHRDHRATCTIVERSIRSLRYRPYKYQYIIWPFKRFRPKLLPLIIKDFFIRKVKGKTKLVRINISEFLGVKKEALLSYKSQTSSFEGATPPLPPSFLSGFLKEYEEFYKCS